ncbi:GNAT family N-acetyltransferase [Terribacillus halophilus]|uniref:GNAT family N-acetyltransferase n=1 Tax=Terribacillus halophilus TaxID=361279 RepID=UPI0009851FDB|nr:GNAT family protein [Terribacillus halophilus]
MTDVKIRPPREEEGALLWKLKYGEQEPEWKKWDAPYFPLTHKTKEDFLASYQFGEHSPDQWVIETNGTVIGTVSYYWEHKPSRWLEMGITIFDPAYWNGGYGTAAFEQWITHLFDTMPIVRVGYTTWSGNKRMMRLGEKLNMTLEARMRKCRYYNGEYYDSIRMGLLREEWYK